MKFLGRYIFSTDHKVIGKQYLWAGLLFLAVGGALAMIMRWQWAYPGTEVPLLGQLLFPESGGAVSPASYTSLFTNHGLIMVFFAVTPILIGALGNFCIPLMIGARDMAFPRLNMWSFWTFALSQVCVLASLLAAEPASAGWTLYPPLSTGPSAPGLGQTLMIIAILLTGVASVMGAINYITTVIMCRAPGMTLLRMPLTIWGQWLTAILTALFVPVLAAAAALLLFDRLLGTQFFSAGVVGGQGDPILYQHLFWIFGHPEVYILILPVWGVVGDLVSVFARKPAHWYRGSVMAMVTIASMSGLVYGHHLYQTGLGPLAGFSFEALTLAITAPAVVLVVNWLCTLWRGEIRLTVPMLFALGTVFVFGIGGLTGIYLGAATTDIPLHDTLFIVGHFHLIMAAATFMGSFAAIYYWFPKMFGRAMHAGLGKIHFWGTLVFLVATFSMVLWAGYEGQPRRLYDPFQYEFTKGLIGVNKAATHAAFALGIFQVIFAGNFLWSVWKGKRADDNPWQAPTLEWGLASPPPEHNFEETPTVVRGPHDFARGDVRREKGKDWLGQDEAWSTAGSESQEKAGSDSTEGRDS